jgi:hypothetical protein
MTLLEIYKDCTFADVEPRKGGPRTLYCKNCGAWVYDTASAEMRKEGFIGHSHHCIRWPDGMVERDGDCLIEAEAEPERR